MARLRIAFMGTPELGAVALEALLQEAEFEIVAAVTQPDRPKGRHLRLTPPPVKELAIRAGIPVLQPRKARDPEFISGLLKIAPDLIAVAAYGQIIPDAILDAPPHGCLNIHTSMLPRYRGAAPIQWAILNGDSETGVTIMKIDAGLDTGDIVSQETTAIAAEDNAITLHGRLATMGAKLIVKTIPEYVSGAIQPRPQPSEGAVYARKIKKEDGVIDWSRNARTTWNQVRGLVPWPTAHTHLPGHPKPELLKIWQAQPVDGKGQPGEILHADNHGIVVGCGENALCITELQREGGRRMSAQEFVTGHLLTAGQQLG